MILKSPHTPNLKEKQNRRKRRIQLFSMAISSGLTFIFCLVIGLAFLQKRSPERFEDLKKLPSQMPKSILNWVKSATVSTDHMVLDISSKNMQKLEIQRKQAIFNFAEKDFSYVNGKLGWKGQHYYIDIKLKGDRRVHFNDSEKWSFRIKIKDDKAMDGMRWFSIHRAEARNYLYEWMFHQLLGYEGFAKLNYQFFRLQLNGTDLGIYALEEGFEKQVVERAGFREGPIIRMDESKSGHVMYLGEWLPFDEEKWTDEANIHLLEHAVSLLEGFRQGNVKVSEVFDTQKMATFFAITDLLKMNHGTVWKSIRFYYNPLTGKLEPIGYDGHLNLVDESAPIIIAQAAFIGQGGWFGDFYQPWFQLFFSPEGNPDQEFIQLYFSELQRVSSKDYLDDFLGTIAPQLDYNLKVVQKEILPPKDHIHWYGPDLFSFSPDLFYQQQKDIIGALFPNIRPLRAFKGEDKEDSIGLSLTNLGNLPIEVIQIRNGDSTFTYPISQIIIPQNRANAMEYRSVSFSDDKWHDSLWQDLWLAYRIWGTDTIFVEKLNPWQRKIANQDSLDKGLPLANYEEFPFIEVDQRRQVIRIKKGKWTVDQPLIFPQSDYFIEAHEGTEIDLINHAYIYSESALRWQGSEKSPILIHSSDQTGEGLVVINTSQKSSLEFVDFNHLSNPKIEGRILSGAINFYQADLTLKDVFVQHSNSEDGVNIVRSNFKIETCGFADSHSDALDIDFSQGEIKRLKILRSGNDGIDFSGSKVKIQGLEIDQAGDKAVSIGEESAIEITGLKSSNANIGLAVKDLSEVDLNVAEFIHCNFGISAYQKKPEFGGGKINLSNITFKEVKEEWEMDKSSEIILNGQKMEEVKATIDH